MEFRVEGLEISRGDLLLARGVSFTLGPGDALTVTGPNGAGKTTLLRALAGLFTPDAGEARLTLGGDIVPVAPNAHYLGHANALKPDLSVRETLAFWAGLLGGGDGGEDGEGLVGEAAGPLGLDPLLDLPAGYLSAGQRRRLALARLWIAPRPLWLLDEPTAALDRRSEGVARDMIEAHRAEGGMVVAATHLDLGLPGARDLRLWAEEDGVDARRAADAGRNGDGRDEDGRNGTAAPAPAKGHVP